MLARSLEQEYVPVELLRRGDLATLKSLRNVIIAARDRMVCDTSIPRARDFDAPTLGALVVV